MTDDYIEFVSSKIDDEKEYVDGISMEIWNNPELKFQEKHAHSLLTDVLEKYGFKVQKEYILKTAFRAEYERGEGSTIAVMCEYDALPEVGHACGHNLIAESGIAAAMAVKAVMDSDPKVKGRIVVLGCPAEEGGGGKIHLINGGTFKDIDAALMVHPGPVDKVVFPTLCNVKATVAFSGKEAHAAAFPWVGLNALDAVVLAHVNIGLLRQQMKPTWRIHTIITKGGTVTNVIPAETEMKIQVRAPSLGELVTFKKKALSCLEAAAIATGCQMECHFEDEMTYLNMIGNKVIESLYGKYAEQLGVEFDGDHQKISVPAGSTDMGNVSYVVPSIHPFYCIGDEKNHTRKFTQLCSAPLAHSKTRTAAKALALTILELLKEPQLIKLAKEAFMNDLKRNRE